VVAEYTRWFNAGRVHQGIHGIPEPDPELAAPKPVNGKLVARPVLKDFITTTASEQRSRRSRQTRGQCCPEGTDLHATAQSQKHDRPDDHSAPCHPPIFPFSLQRCLLGPEPRRGRTGFCGARGDKTAESPASNP